MLCCSGAKPYHPYTSVISYFTGSSAQALLKSSRLSSMTDWSGFKEEKCLFITMFSGFPQRVDGPPELSSFWVPIWMILENCGHRFSPSESSWVMQTLPTLQRAGQGDTLSIGLYSETQQPCCKINSRACSLGALSHRSESHAISADEL